MSHTRNIAFLLGAGAVVDAGLPTSTQLTDYVETALMNEYPLLVPTLRFIGGAVQFGKGCRGESITTKINIEDLLTACSFLASRNQSYVYPFVSAWHEQVSNLQKLPDGISMGGESNTFKFLADYSKGKLQDWLVVDDLAKLGYIGKLADFIESGYKLRIFTLNYDECIEQALSEKLGHVNDRWTTGFNDKGWNPEILNSEDYDAYVYKLHGSLDWVDDERLGTCSIKWPPAQDSEEISDFEPLLIFGTDAKLQAVDPFLTLLFCFRQILIASEVLVVVGYSFEDIHVNAMIREALQHDPQMRCIVANVTGLEGMALT